MVLFYQLIFNLTYISLQFEFSISHKSQFMLLTKYLDGLISGSALVGTSAHLENKFPQYRLSIVLASTHPFTRRLKSIYLFKFPCGAAWDSLFKMVGQYCSAWTDSQKLVPMIRYKLFVTDDGFQKQW